MQYDVETARNGFEELFDYSPEGIWSAPGRVNLIGEHTDYNDGFVFPFAIDMRTFVGVARREDGLVRVSSTFSSGVVEIPLAEIKPETLDGWSAYPLGVIWALGEFGPKLGHLPGLDIYIQSNIPVGSGLSSSAAIECSTAMAINDLWNLGFTRQELAQAGQLAENKAVGAPTGIMDQTASLFGGQDEGVFLDCRSLETTNIPLGLEKAGLTVMVIDTRVKHAHVSGGYASRRQACEVAAETMGVGKLRELGLGDLPRMKDMLDVEVFRRAKHVVTENVRVLDAIELIRQGRITEIGPLLDASHASMRDDFEISIDEIDTAVETASASGAIGARLTGGGFGGAAIALVPKDKRDEIERHIVNAFEQNGFATPAFYDVVPSRAASRDVDLSLNVSLSLGD